MDQIPFFKDLPPAKHNKNKLFQVLDRDGQIYRSDGEYWKSITSNAADSIEVTISGAVGSLIEV